ncbi:MAG: hypothetical protein ACPLRW_12185 [Moorellales bacterium]
MTIREVILAGVVLFLVIYLFISYHRLQQQFYQLLGLTAGLRMRVFEQEIHQLEAPGIFVHEDAAEKLAAILLGLLSAEQRQQLQDEYKKSCPDHIPLWKYLLYQYQFSLQIVPRYNTSKYISPLQIELNEVSEKMARMAKKNRDVMSQLKDSLKELKSQINNKSSTDETNS